MTPMLPQIGCLAKPPIGEISIVSLRRFRDLAHHDEVMSRVDADNRISQLYKEVTELLDVGRIVRGEFERVI